MLDAGDGPQGSNAGTPYLGGYNNYQIPQATGNTRETAGYYSIALADPSRTTPAIIATQFLSGAVSCLAASCTHLMTSCQHPLAVYPVHGEALCSGYTKRVDQSLLNLAVAYMPVQRCMYLHKH